MENPMKMKDDWRYPFFRKPPWDPVGMTPPPKSWQAEQLLCEVLDGGEEQPGIALLKPPIGSTQLA